MTISSRLRTLSIAGASIGLRRTAEGVVEISGGDWLDTARGLGYAHAVDRQTQMMLVRLAGQGRLCECLHDSEETLAVDILMRQLDFARLACDEVERCTPQARALGEAYAEGVNHALTTVRRPWEFRLTGYRPEPWTLADTLLTILLMSYVGLAQTQQDLEKFLIQAIRGQVDVARLKQLFTPHLDALDDELLELIRQVRVVDRVVPPFPAALPSLTSSNSWAVSAQRSATGAALHCCDPHLECNRLPVVWYEAVLRTGDDYHLGVTMPGLPGVIMGRTRHVSAGFTYGFMDQIDYFIEDFRGGACRRSDGFRPARLRREKILRKKHPAVEISVYETDRGTLETDPFVAVEKEARASGNSGVPRSESPTCRAAAPEDGYYLCRALSTRLGGTARSLHVLAEIPGAANVADAQRLLRDVSLSCNWVLADRAGNIGYQQSGLLPARRHSGLFPVPAWRDDLAWQGAVPSDRLAAVLNPPEGVIVSANDDRHALREPLSINVCQGMYRFERLTELLAAKEKLGIADMQQIQADLYSAQARRFQPTIGHLLPATDAASRLRDWDLRYDPASHGAVIFEEFYVRVLRHVFGEGLFGTQTWDVMAATTSLLKVFFQRFDEALLGSDATWYRGVPRETVLRAALEQALGDPAISNRTWGDVQKFVVHNLFFGGKLPFRVARWLGIDCGPFALPGGRATIVQGQIFNTHGRLSTFSPTWRYITDLATDDALTCLAGGPSDRIFSPWYAADLQRWQAGEYKRLRGN